MKYYMAHKYGWYDWAIDQMNRRTDAVIVFICIVVIAVIIALAKLGFFGGR